MTCVVPFDKKNDEILRFLQQSMIFKNLTDKEVEKIVGHLEKHSYAKDEEVFLQGDAADSMFLVESGKFLGSRFGHVTRVFEKGDIFGEIPFFSERVRTGTVHAVEEGTVYKLNYSTLEQKDCLDCDSQITLFRDLAKRLSSYLREDNALYKYMDVLIIQDGGCAPGKNSILAFLTEALEKSGRKVFIAAEGYRSVVSGRDEDFRCLVYNPKAFENLDHIPGVIFSPPLRDARGANFRSERFPEFRDVNLQKKAAQNIIDRHVKLLIAVGGNGTFGGFNALCAHLPAEIQCFFVPVTIDSDVHGTETIGQHTGVEVGAEKVHCYMADARTHHRCYVIEMMGAMGGFHALHSCIGAGAHLAVLPQSQYDMQKIAQALHERDCAVIVVAEGYGKEQRAASSFKGNAAEFFRDELFAAKLDTKMRVICEPFSRDIRGASPNNLDIALAQRMARNLTRLAKEGKSRVMPAVQANREYEIPFQQIRTDNSVELQLAALANRLYQ